MLHPRPESRRAALRDLRRAVERPALRFSHVLARQRGRRPGGAPPIQRAGGFVAKCFTPRPESRRAALRKSRRAVFAGPLNAPRCAFPMSSPVSAAAGREARRSSATRMNSSRNASPPPRKQTRGPSRFAKGRFRRAVERPALRFSHVLARRRGRRPGGAPQFSDADEFVAKCFAPRPESRRAALRDLRRAARFCSPGGKVGAVHATRRRRFRPLRVGLPVSRQRVPGRFRFCRCAAKPRIARAFLSAALLRRRAAPLPPRRGDSQAA